MADRMEDFSSSNDDEEIQAPKTVANAKNVHKTRVPKLRNRDD